MPHQGTNDHLVERSLLIIFFIITYEMVILDNKINATILVYTDLYKKTQINVDSTLTIYVEITLKIYLNLKLE